MSQVTSYAPGQIRGGATVDGLAKSESPVDMVVDSVDSTIYKVSTILLLVVLDFATIHNMTDDWRNQDPPAMIVGGTDAYLGDQVLDS